MAEFDHAGLNELAQELAQGSREALLSAQTDTRQAFVKAYGQGPAMNQTRILEELFPYDTSSRWEISPYGVMVTVNEFGDKKRLGLGEFVGGIAVACGIEPTPKEIETVIFLLGKYMGELRK